MLPGLSCRRFLAAPSLWRVSQGHPEILREWRTDPGIQLARNLQPLDDYKRMALSVLYQYLDIKEGHAQIPALPAPVAEKMAVFLLSNLISGKEFDATSRVYGYVCEHLPSLSTARAAQNKDASLKHQFEALSDSLENQGVMTKLTRQGTFLQILPHSDSPLPLAHMATELDEVRHVLGFGIDRLKTGAKACVSSYESGSMLGRFWLPATTWLTGGQIIPDDAPSFVHELTHVAVSGQRISSPDRLDFQITDNRDLPTRRVGAMYDKTFRADELAAHLNEVLSAEEALKRIPRTGENFTRTSLLLDAGGAAFMTGQFILRLEPILDFLGNDANLRRSIDPATASRQGDFMKYRVDLSPAYSADDGQVTAAFWSTAKAADAEVSLKKSLEMLFSLVACGEQCLSARWPAWRRDVSALRGIWKSQGA